MENLRTTVVFMPNIAIFNHHIQYYYYYNNQDYLQQQYYYNNLDYLQQQYYDNLDSLKNQKNLNGATVRHIWRFPECNMLKLNTDGSSKGNPGPASFGGLIRDGEGRWLCGYMGRMPGRCYTGLEAEIWSIFKGLCLIKEKKMSCLFIETDCQAAILLQPDEGHPLKAVVDAINMMMIEQRCTMIHTRRDGNHCADHLAKLGGKQSEEYTVLEEPPASLMPYLLRDIQAAVEFQRKS